MNRVLKKYIYIALINQLVTSGMGQKLNNLTLYIVDDDYDVCKSLRFLFESLNYKVETYTSSQDFLENISNTPGCLITDVRLPEMSGLELLDQLNAMKINLPVIVITGYGDIPMAVRAMKAGAVDFILKPINEQYILEVVQKTISNLRNKELLSPRSKINLTDREQQIINLLLEGKLNKEIAFDLGISISTVEAHRANIMKKMNSKNLAQLIKTYLQAQMSME